MVNEVVAAIVSKVVLVSGNGVVITVVVLDSGIENVFCKGVLVSGT